MSKIDSPLDIEDLKKADETTRGLEFLWTKKPEGTTLSAYRVKCIGELRKFTSKRQLTWDCVDVELLQAVNDDDVKAGKEYSLVARTILVKKLQEHEPLRGKVFDVAMKDKPRGKRYYDYALRLVEAAYISDLIKLDELV